MVCICISKHFIICISVSHLGTSQSIRNKIHLLNLCYVKPYILWCSLVSRSYQNVIKPWEDRNFFMCEEWGWIGRDGGTDGSVRTYLLSLAFKKNDSKNVSHAFVLHSKDHLNLWKNYKFLLINTFKLFIYLFVCVVIFQNVSNHEITAPVMAF